MKFSAVLLVFLFSTISFGQAQDQTKQIQEQAQEINGKLQNMQSMVTEELTYCEKVYADMDKNASEFYKLGLSLEVSQKDMETLFELRKKSLAASCETLKAKLAFVSLKPVDDVGICKKFGVRQKVLVNQALLIETASKSLKEYTIPNLIDQTAQPGVLACKAMSELRPQVDSLKASLAKLQN